jgi:hypothetical protein
MEVVGRRWGERRGSEEGEGNKGKGRVVRVRRGERVLREGYG